MPQASTAIRTWRRPASGMGFSTSLKGVPGLVISTALIVLAMRLTSWTPPMPLTPGRSAAAVRRRSLRVQRRLVGDLGIHPEDFPVVAVEVVEAPAVHEAVILRFGGVLPAGRDGLPDHLVDFGPATARQREQSFGLPGRVAELALGERLEEGLREKHHVRLFADDHAGRLVVGELGIELEAELREELHRLLQVANGQVDEELPGTIGCHGSLLGLGLQFGLGRPGLTGIIGRCYAGRCGGNPNSGNSVSVSRNEFHPAMCSPDSSSTITAHGW